jgi:hypothetical protein
MMTHIKIAGRWIYLYRAIDRHGQVIDVSRTAYDRDQRNKASHSQPRSSTQRPSLLMLYVNFRKFRLGG